MDIGQSVIVNGHRDLFMDFEAREFIGELCVVTGFTKGGLIRVELKSDPSKTISLPKSNLDADIQP